MASLRKRDKTWYIRFRDASGKQCERKCGPDKSVANGIKRDLENRLVNIKLGESSGDTRVPGTQSSPTTAPVAPSRRRGDDPWGRPRNSSVRNIVAEGVPGTTNAGQELGRCPRNYLRKLG